MNTLRSRNDNGRGNKEQTSNPTEAGTGINVYGGTVNIENLELSIVLPDSKKNCEKCTFLKVNFGQDCPDFEKKISVSYYRTIVLLLEAMISTASDKIKKSMPDKNLFKNLSTKKHRFFQLTFPTRCSLDITA